MKKNVAVLMVAAAALALASCAEPASEDEITEMCQALGNLSAGADTPEALRAKIAAIEAEYAARTTALKDEAKAAADKIDADEEVALAEFKPQDGEKRAAVVSEYAKKQSDKTVEFDGKIKAADLEREAAVGKAKEAADAAEAAWNEIVFKCQADNKGAGKPQAQCRIAATTKDAWEKCE